MRDLIRVVGFVLLCASVVVGQADFSEVEIETTHVAGNVYMLEGMGGNIGVSAGEDGILIIDDQFAPLAEKIRAAFSELSEGELEFVLNTHWHADHVGGNPVFGPEAPIIAHTNVRKRLSTTQEVMGRKVEPIAEEGLPVITFDDSLSVHFNGEEIQAVHLPHGHTDGDTVVFFTGSNVVHMGDDMFSGRFPFVDRQAGGSVVGLAANVAKVLERIPDDAKIIPGHGPLSTVDDLRAYHGMLLETTEIVRKWISEGKSLDEAKAAGFNEEYESWGTGFISEERWIETVYGELSGN
jgi:glyoxylase-like metal-dependent hydrolase (beta-lactamase superfamily II)